MAFFSPPEISLNPFQFPFSLMIAFPHIVSVHALNVFHLKMLWTGSTLPFPVGEWNFHYQNITLSW
jgi:hypothetical protein